MVNKFQVKVHFCITGVKLLPEELTNFLQLTPSKTWLLGDSIQNTALKCKQNGWRLQASNKNADMEKQILSLLKLLIPKKELIKSLCRKHKLECEFACWVDVVENYYPPLHLKKTTIDKISQIGAEVDIDII